MIAGIKGKIEVFGPNYVIIDTGSLSFQVFVPTTTLSKMGETGTEIKLHTHLQVREDNLTLFGFSSNTELMLFEILVSVKGIGPKLALGMLSVMDVEQLTMAIASGDSSLLTAIPGVGKKTAERIVLELKDKISENWMLSQNPEVMSGNSEVVAALTSLGYSVSEATRAVSSLTEASQYSLEEKIKMALHYFGEKKK